MKKTLLYLLLGSALQAGAATSISTSSVSGHWTMAGSPYNIYNDITVLPNTSLSIDAGVEVVFHGLYRLNVQGVLRAVGTAAQRINFRINDTTGWHDDLSAPGGWRGIQYNLFASSGPDTSAFEYCNVSDMKYGAPGYMGYHTGCFFADENRHLTVKNCDFFHNIANGGYGRCIVLHGPQKLDYCSIHDNRSVMHIVSFRLAGGEISHSSIYRNSSIHTLASELYDPSAYQMVKFLNCDIYENTTTSSGAQVYVNTGHAEIRGCKIHHNTNIDQGAILCTSGQVEITGNLICNNRQIVAGTCGMTEGGSAIHLSTNSTTSSWDSTSYIVRNNVITNNYSANGTGAGVYVWHARVWIMNNTIVNNIGQGAYGVAIGLINMGSNAYIKNNILFNNKPMMPAVMPMPEVWVLNCDTVEFENNWMQRPYHQMVTMGSYVLKGDTTTNIIGSEPYLLNPTDSASSTESALASDFSLTALSAACINKGTSGCIPYPTDYAGNPRIFGSSIDIGAHEYQYTTQVTSLAPATPQIAIYPNPTSGNVTISVPAATGLLKITDVAGRIINTVNVTTPTISLNTHTFAKGMYIVEWSSGNSAIQVEKLIIE